MTDWMTGSASDTEPTYSEYLMTIRETENIPLSYTFTEEEHTVFKDAYANHIASLSEVPVEPIQDLWDDPDIGWAKPENPKNKAKQKTTSKPTAKDGIKTEPFAKVETHILHNTDVSRDGRLLYAILASFVYYPGTSCKPGTRILATLMKTDRETLKVHIDELVAAGLIEVARGTGKATNVYTLLPKCSGR